MNFVKRRDFLRMACAAPVFAGAANSLFGGAPAPRPNILLILADDMGYSDLGCYGAEIRTPNLDRLAQGGVRFTQAYNTAKCFPTRACLLTGSYFQRTDREWPGTISAGEVLRPAGYRTLWSGKHHANFNPRTRGFDRYYGLLGGACNYFNMGTEARSGEAKPAYASGIGAKLAIDDREFVGGYIPRDPKFYTTDAFTDRALEWLDEYRKEANPFFLYMAYNAPHWPLHAWPEDIAKCKGMFDKGYEAIRNARHRRQVKLGVVDPKIERLSEAEYGKQLWNELSAEEQRLEARRMEVYAAMIERLDWNIGRLLDRLEKQGKLANTLVLFLSDNGASPEYPQKRVKNLQQEPMGSVGTFASIGKSWATVANTPLRKWKTSSHEGGVRTPLIAHWPGQLGQPGRFCHEPCHIVDFLPTFAELAGATIAREIDGRTVPPPDGISILPVLRGQPLKRPQPLFWQYGAGSAIRDGDWKLVRSGVTWELYDMSKDRTETRDLAAEQPERVTTMAAQWEQWYRDCAGKPYASKTIKKKSAKKTAPNQAVIRR